jgi:hypothetical protein
MEEFNHKLWEYFYEVNKIEDKYGDSIERMLVTRDCYQVVTLGILCSKDLPLPKYQFDIMKVMEDGKANLELLEFTIRTITRLGVNYFDSGKYDNFPFDITVRGFKKIESKESRSFLKWFIRFFSMLENIKLADERGGIIPQDLKVFKSKYVTEKFDIKNIKVRSDITIVYL